ncbi:MAG: CRISPR-associated endonuclease Cas1 [Bacteroidota bacterium]
MQLVLDTSKLEVQKKGNAFYLKSEKGNRTISPEKLTSIAITANVILHAGAIKLAIQHHIPILFFDRIGKAKARMWSPYFASIATLRRQQVKFTESADGTDWMINLFHFKSKAQIQNLEFLKTQGILTHRLLNQSIKAIRTHSKSFEEFRPHPPASCRNNIMGVEGSIARMYWQGVGNALPKQYSFQKRSRRPAQDIFNAAINYGYGMLYSVVEGSLFAVGLDPHLGILHADEYAKPTLAFDLIEPFRPWVDRIIIEEIFLKKMKTEYFTSNQFGIFLNKHGKAWLIPRFNEWLHQPRKFLNREATTKNHIHHLAGLLAKRIRVDIPS